MPFADLEKRKGYHRAYSKEWYQKHKDRWPNYWQSRGEKNKANKRQYDKEYKILHADKIREQRRIRDILNIDARKLQWDKWYSEHKEERAADSARYYANRYHCEINDFTKMQWEWLKTFFKQRCAYCGKKCKHLTKDHITPLSKGGNHTLTNIIPACRACNCSKRDRNPLIPVQPMLISLVS